MFERIRAEERVAIPAEIHLVDGSISKGKVMAGAGRSLADALNGSGGFIEFEPYGGELTFLAKTRLAEIRPLGVPKGVDLKARLAISEPLNPYAILGVAPGASQEQIRKAYLTLVKTYHPDRYASAELPAEVLEYMLTMVRRINAAHAALEASRRAQATAVKPAPAAHAARAF